MIDTLCLFKFVPRTLARTLILNLCIYLSCLFLLIFYNRLKSFFLFRASPRLVIRSYLSEKAVKLFIGPCVMRKVHNVIHCNRLLIVSEFHGYDNGPSPVKCILVSAWYLTISYANTLDACNRINHYFLLRLCLNFFRSDKNFNEDLYSIAFTYYTL